MKNDLKKESFDYLLASLSWLSGYKCALELTEIDAKAYKYFDLAKEIHEHIEKTKAELDEIEKELEERTLPSKNLVKKSEETENE